MHSINVIEDESCVYRHHRRNRSRIKPGERSGANERDSPDSLGETFGASLGKPLGGSCRGCKMRIVLSAPRFGQCLFVVAFVSV
jgi:hypothetical protein